MPHPIFAFVGPSGSGKTTLLLELLRRYPERFQPIKSLTTRPSRGETDKPFYHFTTREDILRRKREGKLIQMAGYAGELYATDREEVDALLAQKNGLMAVIEPAIKDFSLAGYRLIIIKILPQHAPGRGEERAKADAERATIDVPLDFELINSFAPGGKERALEELLRFLQKKTYSELD